MLQLFRPDVEPARPVQQELPLTDEPPLDPIGANLPTVVFMVLATLRSLAVNPKNDILSGSEAHGSYEGIAQRLCISTDQARDCVKELAGLGYIHEMDGGRGYYSWIFLDHPEGRDIVETITGQSLPPSRFG